MQVRPYHRDDAGALAQLFYEAVQTGAAAQYTQEQRDAWCAAPPDAAKWHTRLAALTTFVAEDAHGCAGFMNLRDDGYLDFAYVAPRVMGQGVAFVLYQTIATHANTLELPQMRTDASHAAKPFFMRQGWDVKERQTVERGGVQLHNWAMIKQLLPLDERT